VNFLELIDAYALANRRHYATQNEPGTSNGPYSPDSRETVEAAAACLELHAEIERRLAALRAHQAECAWPCTRTFGILDGEL